MGFIKFIKLLIILVVLLAGSVALGTVACNYLLNHESGKSLIQDKIVEWTGIAVHLNEEISVKLFPTPTIGLNSVDLSIDESKFFSVDQASIEIGIIPLLSRAVRIERLLLEHPIIHLNQAVNESFSRDNGPGGGNILVETVTIASVTVAQGQFSYNSEGIQIHAEGVDATAQEIEIIKDQQLLTADIISFLNHLRFTGQVRSGSFATQSFELSEISGNFESNMGDFRAQNVNVTYLETPVEGSLSFATTTDHTELNVQAAAPHLDVVNLASLARDASQLPNIRGELALQSEFSLTWTHQQPSQDDNQSGSHASTMDHKEKTSTLSLQANHLRIESKELQIEEEPFQAENISFSLVLSDLAVIENDKPRLNEPVDILAANTITGSLHIQKLTVGDQIFNLITSDISGGQYDLRAENLRFKYFEEPGHATFDLSFDPQLLIKAQWHFDSIDLERFMLDTSFEGYLEGASSFTGTLTTQGKDFHEILENSKGQLKMKAHDLLIKGIDLEGVFSRLERSNNSSMNVMSFFTFGALGLMMSHSVHLYETLDKLAKTDVDSSINELISYWRIDTGTISAVDVAMSAGPYLLAFQGGLDLLQSEFDDFSMLLIDQMGCLIVEDTFNGPFIDPDLKNAGILKILLLEPLARIFSGKCTHAYSGALLHPHSSSNKNLQKQ